MGSASTLAIGTSGTISLMVNIAPHGTFGPFFNSAVGTAKDAASSNTTTDTSNDGTDPDPNGNGNPGDTDENMTTSFSLTPNPLIGVAKTASSPVLQSNGSYNITLTFTVQNLGNVALNNVQVKDNLASVFPSPSTFSIVGAITSPVSLVPNNSYNGSSDINLLGAGSTLALGALEHITLTINVAPNGQFGPFFNTANGSASAVGFSLTTSDVSTDGSNPDPNNNHNPSDPGEDVATSISLAPNARIGLAKAVTSSILQSNGSYTVTFSINVKNYGNVSLNSVQVTDDLTTAFGSPTTFTISQAVSSTGGLTPNSSFNGSSNTNLLAAGNSLAPGVSQTLTFSVNVVVNGNFGPFYNSAKATAVGAAIGTPASDISASGTNPDPNGNGDPTDPGENDATPVSLTPNAVMGVAKSASIPVLITGGNYRVTYTVFIQNLGNVPFTNVQVTDNLATTFPSPATFSISGTPVVSGSIIANPSYNGTTDTNLLASGNTLPVGVTQSIKFQVIITPNGSFGPFNNSAVGTASSSAGSYSDISTSGNNPDPNGNGNPGDPGEDAATSISLTPQPILGVAKAATSPSLKPDGSYQVTYTITLKNIGNVTLTNLDVTDDLKSTFNAPATFSLVGNVSASGLLVANPSFDGVTNTSLLSSGTINRGSTQTISFTVAIVPNGNFGPFYNSAVGRGSSGSITYTDISNSGSNPDPNGNGNPGDFGEDTPTAISLSPTFVAGIAKAASLPLQQPDGSYKVTYSLVVKNLGNSTINNIQVKDFLTTSFPAPVTFSVVPGSATTGSFNINSGFNGSTDVNLLAAGSKLPVGASQTITFTAQVTLNGASGIFYNRSTVTAISDDNLTTYTDISSNGTDPDPNGNGNPGDTGENDPTPITLTPHAVIGVAKAAGLALQQGDGSFNVAFTITVKNLGNVVLNQVQVTDDMVAAFPSPITFTVNSIATSGTIPVNPAFNGKTDKNIFAVGGSLSVGGSTVVTFIANIKPNAVEGTFYNSATGSALANGGSGATTDVSANGSNPDPNGNGNPGDPGEDEPTPITLTLSPVVGLAKAAAIPLINATNNSFDVTFTIVVQNLGNTALSNISVFDDIANIFPAGTVFTIKGPIATTGTLVASSTYDAKLQVNLLNPSSTLAIGAKETIKFTINVPASTGVGPYYNVAFGYASNPDNSLTYADISTAGSNPDPNGNGNPNDTNESQPTAFSLQVKPLIGVANAASNPQLKADGTYNVDLTVTVQNLGNEDLSNIVLTNNLKNTFPSVITFGVTAAPQDQGTLIANNLYDGKTQTNLLKSGTLAIGDTKTFKFSINVASKDLFGIFFNSVNATAVGGSTTLSTNDISDNGIIPDPSGDGFPDDGSENDPTPINLIPNLVLGIAKTAVAQITQGNCTYDVTYTFHIQNYGNAIIRKLDVVDSLLKVIPSPAEFNVVSSSSTSGLHLNNDYDGLKDIHLLTQVDSLSPGQQADLSFIIRVTPNDNFGPFINTATISGIRPEGGKAVDRSTDGDLPDPNADNNPNESTPTALTLIPANLFFPQAFSPNGDGQHDLYEITLTCDLSADFLVFNRWGDKVFEQKNYQNDWNGISNQGNFLGKPLPEGTYFYTVELSNDQKYTSFLIIKR